jgi:hypothetical protein
LFNWLNRSIWLLPLIRASLPLYTWVRTLLMKFNLDSEAVKERLGSCVIIGIVSGVIMTIAIFAGMIVLVIYSRHDKNGSDGSSSSAQRDRTSVLVTPEMANPSPEEPPCDGPSDTEKVIERLRNLNTKDIEDQPLIWI